MLDVIVSYRAAWHFGLDWLRIGAFGLLVVYQFAMVFPSPHRAIKTAVVQD